ncbi:MAG: hypothetical protein ACK502_00055 [Alphaproteobacteria bacterium]
MTDAQQPPAPRQDITLAGIAQKKLGELTPDEMVLVIDSLKPKNQLYAGIRFLKILLKRRGVGAVVECVEKIHKILDEEGKLQDYDLEGYEDIFKDSRLNVHSRRNFLHTLGWGIPGAIVTVNGLAKLGDLVVSSVQEKTPDDETPAPPQPEPKSNVFRGVDHWIHDNLGPVEYTIIGAALLNECVEKWKEIKLEQVANAIAEMIDKHPPEKQAQSR